MTGGDLFSSTAMYYSKYRPRYPDGMLQDLLRMTVGDRGRHLVDWGSGSGEVALPLSASFDRVTAIDLDPERSRWLKRGPLTWRRRRTSTGTWGEPRIS